jgi:hypothetical protein
MYGRSAAAPHVRTIGLPKLGQVFIHESTTKPKLDALLAGSIALNRPVTRIRFHLKTTL